ncbi:MAG: pyridoxal phosphate-dependent aminotransferase, partial [Pirellulaceae bacterium]
MATIPPVRRALPASGIRAIFDQAKRFEAAGERVWHLEIGRPDWPMPDAAVLGIREAVEADCVHYVANRGLAELRAAWSQEIASVTGRLFDPETELTVTVGASEGVCMAALALLGPGDEVVIPEPAWPHYHAVALMAGATPDSLPLRMEDRFEMDVDHLRKVITPRTRMIVVNTPGNPTGAVQPASVLRDIARLATHHGIVILSDEVYQDFVYSGEHTSIGRYLEDVELFVYVNSLSKSLAMTGSRVGILGASAGLSKALVNVHQYLTVCGVSYAQFAAHRALV